jgi:ELWxxDGT repeat protein
MRSIVVVFLALFSFSVCAQAPYLVKDINTTYLPSARSSLPTSFTAWNGRTYFVATLDASGTELWSTDGTSQGTRIVADIIPGSAGSSPSSLSIVNGTLLFTARDVDHGVELWTTDGTASGTHRLLDLNPGPNSSTPGARILYKNRMLFTADDGVSGRELWITDGTASGTRLLRDLEPGSASSSPTSFVQLGDTVYFYAAGAIWKTDGTDAGTIKVVTMTARNFRVAGSLIFLQGFTAATGWELWVSDGTDAGTHMVTEIVPGTSGGLTTNFSSVELTPFGDRLLFPATDAAHGRELWISDGTAAGTHLVRDLIPGSKGRWDNDVALLTTFGSRAYFSAFDQEHGYELWVTDGTESGTTLFIDFAPGAASSSPFTVVSGAQLYIGADARLWVSDGTTAGTHLLQVADGPQYPGSLSPIDGKVYFSGSTSLTGSEPWISDGTSAGTRMIANLSPDPVPSSTPAQLTAARDLLFFYATRGKATNPNSPETTLWRSDGTEAGTFPVGDPAGTKTDLTAVGPFVFFPDGYNSTNYLLNDGTPGGTRSAALLLPPFGGAPASAIYPFGDTLFVNAGNSLWKTASALNAPAVSLGSIYYPHDLIEVAGQYAFYASMGQLYDYGLWMTDGTTAGTRAVVPRVEGINDYTILAAAAGNVYFITAKRDQQPPALWKSDGTFDGTVKVKDLPFGDVLWGPHYAAAQRKLFFESNGKVWVSDGTESGTMELVNVGAEPSTEVTDFKAAGDRVVFLKKFDVPGGYNSELWSTDGTPAGTRVLKQLGAVRTQLGSFDGNAYFAAPDDVYGTELWMTNGTPEGTKMAADLNPGAASSSPYGFAKVRNTLYFSAQTDTTGLELWALPLTEPVLTVADTHATEGDTGTSVARFVVSLNPASSQNVTVSYATADGIARAGEDYEAASGTLTFSPGETSKTIDVRIIGDTAVENNESFFVTLRDANGARVVKADAAGVVTDDDQTADVSIVPSFVNSSTLGQDVLVSNAGPRAATNIKITITTTPDPYDSSRSCYTCSIPQLATGKSTLSGSSYISSGDQVYRSAFVSAQERDPQTSNNVTSWTANSGGSIAMNAAYLTTGATATITTRLYSANPTITNSDPAVIAVPPAVTKVNDQYGTFVITALKPGTSTIRIDPISNPLLVTVVAPGTAPRWPGAVNMSMILTGSRLDQPAIMTIKPAGRAPMTGALATGTITASVGGHELARRTLSGSSTSDIVFPVYLPAVGPNALRVEYSGDTAFLPQSAEYSVFMNKGNVTLTGGLEATGSAYKLTVNAAGSPAASPTGTLVVLLGSTELTRVALSPSNGGVSTAQATLTNLPASPTLTVQYLGDAFYNAGSQQIRVVTPRRRSARH